MNCKLCGKEMIKAPQYWYDLGTLVCETEINGNMCSELKHHYAFNSFEERIFLSDTIYLFHRFRYKYILWTYNGSEWMESRLKIPENIMDDPKKALDKINMLMVFK